MEPAVSSDLEPSSDPGLGSGARPLRLKRPEVGRVAGSLGGSGGGCSVTLINQRPGASRGHKGSERPL